MKPRTPPEQTPAPVTRDAVLAYIDRYRHGDREALHELGAAAGCSTAMLAYVAARWCGVTDEREVLADRVMARLERQARRGQT